jgi:hypothetical protein
MGSRLYRAEYGAAAVAIMSYLVWRTFYGGGVDWLQVVFWAAFPDLAAFIPIAASSQRREWPAWGPGLYNAFHTLLTWGVVFAALWLAFGSFYLPLLGWLLHIAADRASGYYLRASRTSLHDGETAGP